MIIRTVTTRSAIPTKVGIHAESRARSCWLRLTLRPRRRMQEKVVSRRDRSRMHVAMKRIGCLAWCGWNSCGEFGIMRRIRKRGRVVEGSSLENCRRCEPFVSSNLTASARKQKNQPPSGGFFVSWRKRAGRLRALRVRFEGPSVLREALSESPICSSPAGRTARRAVGALSCLTFAVNNSGAKKKFADVALPDLTLPPVSPSPTCRFRIF